MHVLLIILSIFLIIFSSDENSKEGHLLSSRLTPFKLVQTMTDNIAHGLTHRADSKTNLSSQTHLSRLIKPVQNIVITQTSNEDHWPQITLSW